MYNENNKDWFMYHVTFMHDTVPDMIRMCTNYKANLYNMGVRALGKFAPEQEVKKFLKSTLNSWRKEEKTKYAQYVDLTNSQELLPTAICEIAVRVANSMVDNGISVKFQLPVNGIFDVYQRGYNNLLLEYKSVMVTPVTEFTFSDVFQIYHELDHSVAVCSQDKIVAVAYRDSGTGVKNKNDFFIYVVINGHFFKDRLLKYKR